MKLVLDTSILIDHLRGGSLWKGLLDRLEREDAELFIPTIVIFELYSGVSTKKSENSLEVKNLIKNFHQIELTEKIATYAGELYRDISHTFQVPDYIIAASALEIEAEIITLNIKHFEQVPGLQLYKL